MAHLGRHRETVWLKLKRIATREHECCGQKIAYFLEGGIPVSLSAPKICEILAEKCVIRSKWHKNQKRETVPTVSAPRTVIQMDTVEFDQVVAFTGIDIYTKESAVVPRPALTNEDGVTFLQTARAHRVTGDGAVRQTDGGLEVNGSVAQGMLRLGE